VPVALGHVRWASAIATADRLEDAVAEAADSLANDLGGARPDLVCAFVTDHHAPHFGRLQQAVSEVFPGALLLGCSAGGAIGGGVEVEHECALSLTAGALPGVTLTPFHLGSDRAAWRRELDVRAEDDPAFLLLPCPLSSPVDEILAWMDKTWPGAVKVGGLASGGMTTRGPARNALFLGDERLESGAVGVAFTGDVAVDTVVSQGCRPIGTPMFVTRAAKNVAYELDGEPSLAALEKLHASLAPEDRALFRHSLFIGVGMREGQARYGRGDFLVRNLVGVDPDTGALAVGAPLKTGMVVQFQLRDAKTSEQDLAELLAQHEHVTPSGALMFSCVGRGRLLYGKANHDSEIFHEVMGPVPLGGFFCNGEIGPVSRRSFLHGQTSSFALFRRRAALA
jgi:small ligand-binding sensory domain FIST